MKALFLIGGLIAVGACTPSSSATGPAIERVTSRPLSATYSAFKDFTDHVASRQVGAVCGDPMCDKTTTIHFLTSGTPQQSLSLTMLRGQEVMASALASFAPGDTPSSTRVSIAIDDRGSTSAADKAKLEALVDAMIDRVNHGEAIPVTLVTTTS